MNKLYFGDNLVILKEHIAYESIDLNKSRSDAVPIAQGEAKRNLGSNNN